MPPSTDWKETIAEGEDARFRVNAETLREVQRALAKNGSPSRALHAKGQAQLEATFEVLGELPTEVAQGLFAKPGTYRAYVRFSNGSGARQADRKDDVRGIAIKVLGVAGQKLIPGMEHETTQDFLMIKSPAVPFRNVDEFVTVIVAAQNPLLLLPRLIGGLGFGRTFAILPKLAKGLGAPIPSLATTRYWGPLPLQWGPYAAKTSLLPTERSPERAKTPEDLGAELATRLQQGPVTYDFAVQLFVDANKTPIEDPTVEWVESDAPFVKVARLTLNKQDVDSQRGKKLVELIEAMSFDPWHALVEHKPLGAMMRARNPAYMLSTQERKAAKEPDGTEMP